jgi:hypothetical protein
VYDLESRNLHEVLIAQVVGGLRKAGLTGRDIKTLPALA